MSDDATKTPTDGHWLGKLDDAFNEAHPIGDDESFPSNINSEEAAFGFQQTVIPNQFGHYAFTSKEIRAALAELPGGMVAVKMRRPDGAVNYAIWDRGTHRPVQRPAGSVAELRARFGQ